MLFSNSDLFRSKKTLEYNVVISTCPPHPHRGICNSAFGSNFRLTGKLNALLCSTVDMQLYWWIPGPYRCVCHSFMLLILHHLEVQLRASFKSMRPLVFLILSKVGVSVDELLTMYHYGPRFILQCWECLKELIQTVVYDSV